MTMNPKYNEWTNKTKKTTVEQKTIRKTIAKPFPAEDDTDT